MFSILAMINMFFSSEYSYISQLLFIIFFK